MSNPVRSTTEVPASSTNVNSTNSRPFLDLSILSTISSQPLSTPLNLHIPHLIDQQTNITNIMRSKIDDLLKKQQQLIKVGHLMVVLAENQLPETQMEIERFATDTQKAIYYLHTAQSLSSINQDSFDKKAHYCNKGLSYTDIAPQKKEQIRSSLYLCKISAPSNPTQLSFAIKTIDDYLQLEGPSNKYKALFLLHKIQFLKQLNPKTEIISIINEGLSLSEIPDTIRAGLLKEKIVHCLERREIELGQKTIQEFLLLKVNEVILISEILYSLILVEQDKKYTGILKEDLRKIYTDCASLDFVGDFPTLLQSKIACVLLFFERFDETIEICEKELNKRVLDLNLKRALHMIAATACEKSYPDRALLYYSKVLDFNPNPAQLIDLWTKISRLTERMQNSNSRDPSK